MKEKYMPSEAKKNNEQYMPKGASGVMGHEKSPKAMQAVKVEPMSKSKMNKGYPTQAYKY